ncbi:hypothetical protein [Fusobacterium ulcerans]|uniref:hypothetical protein n=1 Tax=Fusobacterium ulcerans TaxID=861 RepID=UPI00102FFF3E|nr:hypothetical protein [Fusobacterium ulcerans]
MYYSIFLEVENNPEIKKWLNMNTKDEIIEILKGLPDEGVKKLQIVETSTETTGEYDLIKRFIKETQILGEKFFNEKYPFYYAKDITEEIIKK